MGDRASISFKKDGDESVVLCSHWGGKEFQSKALKYAKELAKKHEGKRCYPIERLEPQTVMVDFIRKLTKNMQEVNTDLYLGKDTGEVDNSDNGHKVIDFDKIKKMRRITGEE